jgi:hypothetical protein
MCCCRVVPSIWLCDYWQTFKLNALETLYLVTSLLILLSGMTFQSGVAAVGSGPHLALTYIVMVVLIGSVGIAVLQADPSRVGVHSGCTSLF